MGGAERRTLELARALEGRYTFHFISLSPSRGTLCGEIERAGGVVHLCASTPRLPVTLWRVLREVRPGAIDSHVHYSSGVFIALAALAGVPLRIAHFRSTNDGNQNTLRRRAYRAAMRGLINIFATHIVGVSEGVLDCAWPGWRADDRCRVLYNGVAAADGADGIRGRPWPADLRVVTVIGSLNPAKNQLFAVQIARELRARDTRTLVVFVGRSVGEYGRSVEAAIRAEPNTTWLGERRDVVDILRWADALLLPSIREGLPGVMLEACSVGLPVVASDVPGAREIALHFPSVLCLSLGEGAATWAEAVLGLPTRTEGRQLSKALFNKSPFTIEACAARFKAIMEGA
jgi:glycosyltransferase involved in cell wall biosynthesis